MHQNMRIMTNRLKLPTKGSSNMVGMAAPKSKRNS